MVDKVLRSTITLAAVALFGVVGSVRIAPWGHQRRRVAAVLIRLFQNERQGVVLAVAVLQILVAHRRLVI